MPISYSDNKVLTDALSDLESSLRMARLFIAESKKEYRAECPEEETEDETTKTEKIFFNVATGNLRLIHACAESPIEKIFLSSIVMGAIKGGTSTTAVFTVPMDNTIENMKTHRGNVKTLKAAIKKKKVTTDGVLAWINEERESGLMSQDEWRSRFELLWNYVIFDNERSLHITPQPSFPKLLPSGKGVRGDILFWCPAIPSFRVVVECDSYQYHDNHETFDKDRQRSRALQAKGFEVLQFSGGEIYRDPVGTAVGLYTQLSERCRKREASHVIS